jgi:hypothetical protein
MMTNDPALPSYQRPERAAIQPDLDLVSDLIAGTRRLHEKASTYIRQWKDENDAVYAIRSRIENCFEGTGRTLSAAVGMLFSQPPAIDWNQSEVQLAPHWDNLDMVGAAGHVFLKRFSEKAIRDGLALILVDHTPLPAGVNVSPENEETLGLRPKWAIYDRSQILSWRSGVINNRTMLTQVVLYECGTSDSGEFGVKTVHRYRKLSLRAVAGAYAATWEVFEYTGDDVQGASDAKNYRSVANGAFKDRKGRTAGFLPIAIAYAGRSDGIMQASMPLLGVANANLAHYQASTDLRFYRSLCAFPQRMIKGELRKVAGVNGELVAPKVPAGPMVVLHLEENADAAWDELQGTSMDQLEKGIAEKLAQIGAMGMAFLVPQTRMAETAEAKRIDAVAQNATLSTAGQAIEDAANLALEYHAWFMGIEKKAAPRVEIAKSFEDPVMSPEEMTAWANVSRETGIDLEIVFTDMQKRGRIAKDVDVSELADRARFNAEQKRLQREQEARDRMLPIGAPVPMDDAA